MGSVAAVAWSYKQSFEPTCVGEYPTGIGVIRHGKTSVVTGFRALVANVMLERARELSGPQALELWRLTQLIDTGASLDTLPRAMLQMAMDFNRFPHARRVVEQKALAHESATDKLDAIN